jgi:hypothetical protein
MKYWDGIASEIITPNGGHLHDRGSLVGAA